jgi:hypothetical protein
VEQVRLRRMLVQYVLDNPFSGDMYPDSPDVDVGKECIRLAVPELSFSAGHVSITFRSRYLFPHELADRYQRAGEAMVLVVNDVEQRDGFSVRTSNDFITYPDGVREGPNLLKDPPLPFPGRGDPRSGVHRGGWMSGWVSFGVLTPVLRPSVFLYLILENHVSNVVALDLVDQRALEL